MTVIKRKHKYILNRLIGFLMLAYSLYMQYVRSKDSSVMITPNDFWYNVGTGAIGFVLLVLGSETIRDFVKVIIDRIRGNNG